MVEQKSILMSVDGSIALLHRGITKFEEKNLTGCQIILYFYLFCANQPTIGVKGELVIPVTPWGAVTIVVPVYNYSTTESQHIRQLYTVF